MIKKATIRLPLFFLGLLLFSSSSFCTNHMVDVANFSFSPSSVNAMVGDTITWNWVSGTHTTTCNGTSGTSLPPGATPWDAPINSSSTTFSYVIEIDGDYNFVCLFHPSMIGMIMATPLPVELVSFSVYLNDGFAELQWKTATESNNNGFDIERKSVAGWEKVGFVQGNGTTTSENSYNFRDDVNKLQNDIISYRLKQIDFNGSYEYSAEVQINRIAPSDFSLMQNFPNPFNPTTQINFSVPQTSHVILKVYDVNGSEVATLLNQNKSAGNYAIDFNASDLASGIYYYTITAGSFSSTKKMILVK